MKSVFSIRGILRKIRVVNSKEKMIAKNKVFRKIYVTVLNHMLYDVVFYLGFNTQNPEIQTTDNLLELGKHKFRHFSPVVFYTHTESMKHIYNFFTSC